MIRLMSGESYTRWRSEPSDDEDEEERAIKGGHHGRSSVTVVPVTSRTSENIQQAAYMRIICVIVLVCTICCNVGGLIGYYIGSQRDIPMPLPLPIASNFTYKNYDDDKLIAMHVENLSSFLKPEMIKRYLRGIPQTSNKNLTDYIESMWRAQGLETTITSFTANLSRPSRSNPNDVLLNYMDGHWERLNPLPDLDVPPYLAYSPAGTVSGSVVYGHYGRWEDLQVLQTLKINIKDSILLLRHGKLHTGSKVHNAQQAGAAGVLLYPDPVDFEGDMNGGLLYPKGAGLPHDGVIWKTLNTLPGDPTTPFLPSIDNIYRISETPEHLPSIPAHTVSSRLAARLMTLMDGPQVPDPWKVGLDLVTDSGDKLKPNLGGTWKVNITNLTLAVNNEVHQDVIKNIHATLPSSDNTRVLMIGCHYGALHREPSVGLASMLALSESLHKTFRTNGTQRKVVFSAWAANQDGMVGSTEFAQLYDPWMDKKVMGYLSMDDILVGTGTLRAMASPTLRESIREAAKLVNWAEKSKTGLTLSLKDGWRLSDPLGNKKIHITSAGSGSDFVSFIAQNGVPSAHFMATSQDWRKTYSLQHSQYDSLEAFDKFLDPHYNWTHMITSLVGALTILLTEKELPPVIFSEMSGDLYNGWRRFLDRHNTALNNSGYEFDGIRDSIEKEIIALDSRMECLDNWYNDVSLIENKVYVDDHRNRYYNLDHHRRVEERLQQLLTIERSLLGPRGISRSYTTNVMIGPDPSDTSTSIHYPHVAKAITLALQKKAPWENVHKEFSYILAALASYREIFHAHSGENGWYPS